MYQSKSFNQFVLECNVSHGTACRKIRWLIKEKLLIADTIEITEDSKISNHMKSGMNRTV
jgi:hypothetical protein